MSGFELGALAEMGTAIGVIAIVLIVLTVIAHWRMFTKAGVEGWKAIIPVYSDYVLFDLVWDTRNFWIYIGITIATSALNLLASNIDGGFIMSAITMCPMYSPSTATCRMVPTSLQLG